MRIAGTFQTDLTLGLSDTILSLMLPVRSSGMQRFIGLVPPELSTRSDPCFEDVRSHLESLFGVRVVDVNWFATYRVHHRVAEHFRIDRTFLLGDAAHIHSPAGGQGMNTGIGDAINLLAPLFFTLATRFEIGRRTVFRTVSQIRIRYPQSTLSEGQAGQIRGGDRLPWTGDSGVDNFAPLQSFDWQLHVWGTPTADLKKACQRLNLPLHVFGWSGAAERAGFKNDAFYVVRPDGYVGLASATQDVGPLKEYVRSRGVRA